MAVAAGLALAAAGGAYAQFSPKEAVGVRVNGYRETGAAFKTLNDQLKSDTPIKIMLRTSARRIVETARDQYGYFPQGSGKETGEKTKAKAEIWSDPAGFKAVQDNFQKQAALMSQAVDAGDVGQMKTQAHALGEACAACHNKYREKE
jgi:cytochrome c556